MKSKYKNLCKGLAITILVLGVIGSIALAVVGGEVKEVSYSAYSGVSARVHRDGAATFAYLISGWFGTFVLFVILSALGEVLEYLETLFKKATNVEDQMTDADQADDEELPIL